MTVFNKRNALVGYATLEALKYRRRTKKRKAPKIALYLGLGLVSAGILAALVAVLLHKRRNGSEAQELQGYAVGEEAQSDSVQEDTASSEPIPATT
jgi:hypothetical protein